MDFPRWIAEFRALHDRARRGELSGADRTRYLADRNDFARALLASQRLTLAPGQRPREILRAKRALRVELVLTGRTETALTLDVSSGGFSAFLGEEPGPNALAVKLLVPQGDPVAANASCVHSARFQGRVRCSFRFEEIGEADRERLELLVFDALLEHLRG